MRCVKVAFVCTTAILCVLLSSCAIASSASSFPAQELTQSQTAISDDAADFILVIYHVGYELDPQNLAGSIPCTYSTNSNFEMGKRLPAEVFFFKDAEGGKDYQYQIVSLDDNKRHVFVSPTDNFSLKIYAENAAPDAETVTGTWASLASFFPFYELPNVLEVTVSNDEDADYFYEIVADPTLPTVPLVTAPA